MGFLYPRYVYAFKGFDVANVVLQTCKGKFSAVLALDALGVFDVGRNLLDARNLSFYFFNVAREGAHFDTLGLQ